MVCQKAMFIHMFINISISQSVCNVEQSARGCWQRGERSFKDLYQVYASPCGLTCSSCTDLWKQQRGMDYITLLTFHHIDSYQSYLSAQCYGFSFVVLLFKKKDQDEERKKMKVNIFSFLYRWLSEMSAMNV